MEQGRLAAFFWWCVLHRVPCVGTISFTEFKVRLFVKY